MSKSSFQEAYDHPLLGIFSLFEQLYRGLSSLFYSQDQNHILHLLYLWSFERFPFCEPAGNFGSACIYREVA